MRQELIGLKGGKKQFWLRVHRKQIENYRAIHGDDETKLEFNMSDATFKRFNERKGDDDRINKLSENDRYVLRMSMEASRTVATRVRMLEERVETLEQFEAEIQPIIELGRAILSATSQGIIAKVEQKALPADPLRIEQLLEKSKE